MSIGFHLYLKSRTFHWYLSDENIYYYLARDMGMDHLPYSGFFYANPPFLLVLLKASGVLTDWSVVGLRLVPLLCHLLVGVSFFFVFRGRLGLLALVPTWVCWWSYDALRASTHASGITETLGFCGIAFLFASQKRPVWAAVAWGVAFATKFYAVALFPAIALLAFLSTPERGFSRFARFIGPAAAAAAATFVLGLVVGGESYWTMNFSYHLAKDVVEDDVDEVFLSVLIRNQATAYILAAAAAWWLTGWMRIRPASPTPPEFPALRWLAVGVAAFLSVLIFLLLQKKIFDFYLLLFLPGAAFLLSGFLATACAQAAEARWETGRRIAFLGFAFFLLSQSLLPREYRLFIRDRVSYWDHEIRTFDDLAEWKPLIQPDDTILGDSGTAPVVALMTGARLSLGEGDTNYMRFLAGMPTPSQFIAEADQEGVDWLVVRGTRTREGRFRPSGMFSIPEFRDYAAGEFEMHKALGFGGSRAVVLMRRKTNPPEDSSADGEL